MVPSWDKWGESTNHHSEEGKGECDSASGAGFPVGGSSAARCGVAVLSCNDQH